MRWHTSCGSCDLDSNCRNFHLIPCRRWLNWSKLWMAWLLLFHHSWETKTNLFGQNTVLISQTSFPSPVFQFFQLTVFCLKTSSLQIADDIKHWIRDQRAKTTTFLDLCNSSMNKTLFQTEFPLLKKLNT